MAGPKHSELPAVVVPQHLWLRSARPVNGKIVQWALPGVLILAGLLSSATTLRVSLVLAGISVYLLLPGLVTSRLEQMGLEVMAADRKRAAELLNELPERALVRLFAPAGWRALQLAQLHLKLGEGHQAALGFAETAQLCGQPEAVMLVSAQAHAYVVAGERPKARELLQKLAQANLVGPRDQLDLGIVLLIETKKFKQALSYIEAARKTIGDHPRVLAAQALGLQKAERIEEATALIEQIQAGQKDATSDSVADDLIKRARKGMQDYLEAQLRRERRARSRRTTIVVSSEAAASEIVSGEISGTTDAAAVEANFANLADSRGEEPSRRFGEAEPPSTPTPAPAPVVASKPAERDPDAPQPRDPDAPQPGLEIDLFSVPHTSAPALSDILRNESLSVPTPPTPPSLIVPKSGEAPAVTPPVAVPVATPPVDAAAKTLMAETKPIDATAKTLVAETKPAATPIDVAAKTLVAETKPATPVEVEAKPPTPAAASKTPAPNAAKPLLSTPGPRSSGTSLFTMPTPTPSAASETRTETPKPTEAEAPQVRQRQTMIGVLPGEPNKPPAPALPSLNTMNPGGSLPTGAPRTGLPTRATRLDLPAIGTPPAPNTAGPAPVFRAPPTPPKPDEKKG